MLLYLISLNLLGEQKPLERLTDRSDEYRAAGKVDESGSSIQDKMKGG